MTEGAHRPHRSRRAATAAAGAAPTLHLRGLSVRALPEDAGYPFDVPAVRTLEALTFDAPVTCFVGENGSGKSTLLEAIACAAGSIAVGSEGVGDDGTLAPARALARHLKLIWNAPTHRGFFLRAEDFFGYAKRMSAIKRELKADLKALDAEYADRSAYALGLAKTPFLKELADLEHRYGEGLDQRSHGESFLALFQSRFVPGGLYLLDEPEAPLSPIRQLALISAIKAMVEQRGQFIIATHSPILLAYPGATILDFDTLPIRPVAYEDLAHVSLTRD
ncbi:MAG: AAA family ATPase, partial [Ardenticatenales bacterium]